MKNVSINLLTNVLLLLVGVILIIFHAVPDLLVWAVRLMGTMFMVLAVVYMVMVAVRHAGARTSSDYMGVMPAVGGLCFGLVLMLKAPLFDAILQQLMGMLLVVLGGFHIVYLWMSRDKLKIGGWYYVLPVIVVLCGILSMVLPALRDHASPSAACAVRWVNPQTSRRILRTTALSSRKNQLKKLPFDGIS